MSIKRAIERARRKIITALGGSTVPPLISNNRLTIYEAKVQRYVAGYAMNPLEAGAYGPAECFEIARRHIIQQMVTAIDEAGLIQYTREYYAEAGKYIYRGELCFSEPPPLDPDKAEQLDPRRPFSLEPGQWRWTP